MLPPMQSVRQICVEILWETLKTCVVINIKRSAIRARNIFFRRRDTISYKLTNCMPTVFALKIEYRSCHGSTVLPYAQYVKRCEFLYCSFGTPFL